MLPDGDLLLADWNSPPMTPEDDSGTLFRVHPLDGQTTVLATGLPLLTPFSLAIGADGRLALGDNWAAGVRDAHPVAQVIKAGA